MAVRRLVIVDGYALLYRAFFATRYLSTSDGRPTNALYGFTSMLFALFEKEQPNALVVALDAPGKTFRHAEYDGYKATRKETADELRVQLREARNFIAALGIPSVEVVGFEADDVVGTISRLAEENGYDTLIVTGDLDALQLVDNHVSVMTPKMGMSDTVIYDPAAVVERYGFGPEFIPDYKALKGDTSDNIPGVPGIGDKGAADLIQKFGTIENMIERFAEIEPKYQKKIDGNQDQMRQSKHLATIVRDVSLQYDFEPMRLNDEQMKSAVAMLDSFEFKQLVRRAPFVLGKYLDGQVGEPSAEVVDQQIEVSVVEAPDPAAWIGNRPYAIFFSSGGGKDLFDDTRRAHIAIGNEVVETSEAIGLQILAERPELAILHDAKPSFKKLGASHAQPKFDTLLAAFVLRSERSQFALRDLVSGYLEVLPPETPAQMASALYLLESPLRERLEKEDQLAVLQNIELPLIPILTEMERVGIPANRDSLREFSKSLQVTIEQTTAKVYELAGQTFTIGSPKQLGEILFEKLKIPGAQKTKTGYATGVEVLGELAAQYEIVREVLNYRELTKLKSTYADSLQNLIREDGRIHTTYHQTGAATGRLSSNDPNMQNIPIRTELGRGIRKAFYAAEGYTLASIDYSQIELRVLAHMCEEPALVKAFETGEDVHTVTAQHMFGLGDGAATKQQRGLAKMLNYAVLYGVSEWGLAQQLGSGFSVGEAKALIQQYNDRFPTVKEFTNGVIAEARSKGFTTTLRGRRRYFPDIHAARMQERKYAERQAMNAPIQGTAADMIKLAMISCRDVLANSPSRMLLNVHDELVFEIAHGDEDVIPKLRVAMETALPLKVPVEADAKVGHDWNEMTPV